MTSAKVPDVWEWYTPERIDSAEKHWAGLDDPKRQAAKINELARDNYLSSVLEFGCGTGWVPMYLDKSLSYCGIDRNPHMLERARAKNPGRYFRQADIRDVHIQGYPDIVCAFAFTKHFSVADCPEILSKLMSLGHWCVFTQHIIVNSNRESFEQTDEGWYSSWLTRREFEQVARANRHVIWEMDLKYSIDPLVGEPEALVVTHRI